jgi:hypothetical protein
MALSIGNRSRSILNGTHTVPLQHSHPIQGYPKKHDPALGVWMGLRAKVVPGHASVTAL